MIDFKFEPFPKIPRMRRTVYITEKIDGTNAAIRVHPMAELSMMAYSR
jgi:hypothetical protein